MRRRFRQGVLCRVGAAMAGGAIAGCRRSGRPGVAHLCRGKGREVLMAGIALRRRRDMSGILAQGRHAMTGGAATSHWRIDRGVIKRCRRPSSGGLVAIIALLCGRDMVGRLRLRILRNISPVVASRALSCQTGMVHARRRKCGRTLMTRIALRRRRDMVGGFGQGILCYIGTIVAS